MFYYFFTYLERHFDLSGAGVFNFISFRAIASAACSVLFTVVFGKRLIEYLQKQQIGEVVRDLGLAGQMAKKGTPTMGGVIIIGAIVFPTLLFAKISNVYIMLLLVATLWAGLLGFLDDYLKLKKQNKDGLSGKYKIVGQVLLGLTVGVTLHFNPYVKVREFADSYDRENSELMVEGQDYRDVKSLQTTIPFLKSNELNYHQLVPFLPHEWTWIFYVLVVTFIITAVSNGANITDGLDGLAAGTSAIIAVTLAVLAYVSGNYIFADYLNIMYIPDSGEITVFCAALVGACIGFLWYNAYPAQVFMGDTGSLSLGATIAVLALVIRKELLIPVLCGIFLIENLSVIAQVSYYKWTKKRFNDLPFGAHPVPPKTFDASAITKAPVKVRYTHTGYGKRLLKMSPLHHHYQKSDIPEPKIVARFWIVGILLALLTLATLKIR